MVKTIKNPRCGLVLVFGAVLYLAAAAEERQQPFRATTQLVEVPVIVTDRRGNPVIGLTADDFSITEDGVSQTIRFFQVNDTREARTPAPSLASSSPEAARTFSNRPQNPTGTSTVILLDRLNAAFDSQWFARKHVHKYLSEMREGDSVALYVLDGSIRVLHDFTTNADSLMKALDKYEAVVSGHYDASNEPPAEMGTDTVWIVDPSTAVSEFFTTQRSRNTFIALQVLARHLAGVAGRKSVVWVSEVFPMPKKEGRLEFLEEMRKTERALNQAQAALYPVDARGLVGAITYSRGRPSFTSFERVRANIETMEEVAEETGGRTFANTNALNVSIRRAIDDSRLTYVLGYYPPDSRTEGRYRRITVKVRNPDLIVRHRRGYLPTSARMDQKSRDAALREALRAPLAATQIALAGRGKYDRTSSRLTLNITLDLSNLTLELLDGRWRGSVDLLVAEVGSAGRATISHTEKVDISIPDSERARVFRDGLPATIDMPVDRRFHQIRIVAYDALSGRTGSLVIAAADLR